MGVSEKEWKQQKKITKRERERERKRERESEREKESYNAIIE